MVKSSEVAIKLGKLHCFVKASLENIYGTKAILIKADRTKLCLANFKIMLKI